MGRAEKVGRGWPEGLSRGEFLKLGGAGLGGVALLGVAGCGGGQESASGVEEVVFSFGPDSSGTMQNLIDRFNERHEGEIRVRWREMAADTGQYFDQLRTQFQAGGGDIDVIGGDVIWPAQFAANGWISDLSDRFPEEERQGFLQAPIEANTWEGAIYGVPWFTDAGMLYYRQDLLEQAGFSEPPKTWEELIEMARKTAQDSGTQFGFVFQGGQYEGGVVNGLEYIWTHGGDVLNARADEVIIGGGSGAVGGLTTERSMIESGVAPQSVVNYNEQRTDQAFLRGDAVFARNWPYMYGLANDPETSNVKPGRIGISRLPAQDGGESFSGLGGWNFYVNAASEKADAAWEFIRYMTSEKSQKYRAIEGGFLPTRNTLYDDREILEKVPVVRLGEEAIKSARPRPVSPVYSDMSLEMAEQFNASLDGEVPPERAVEALQERLGEIVEQAAG